MTATILKTKISEVENKVPDTSSLVTRTVLNTKMMKWKIKFLIMLNTENFAARLKQVNLLNKTDFDKKLISFNKQITSNQTKYLEV